MPFEFSGAPPALLDGTSVFSSFAFPSQPTTSTPPAPSNSSGAFASFARTTQQPFKASFGTGLSFGPAAKPAFGSTPPWPSSPLQPQCKAPNTTTGASTLDSREVAAPARPEADDPLSKALVRASRGKSAVFGRSDIAADGILKSIFNRTEEARGEIETLLTGLREAEASSPAVARFIRSLFGESIRAMTSRDEQPVREASPAAASDATEEATMTNRDIDSITSSDCKDPRIPRDHWRTKGLSAHLADVLLDEGHIWYKEGARVLADYILDLAYDHSKDMIVEKVVALLARQDNDAAVDNVVHWTQCKLGRIQELYLLSGGGSDRPAGNETGPKHAISPPISNRSICASDMLFAAEDEDAPEPLGTAMSKPAEKPFRFLDLPAELRNWVYRDVLAPGYIGFHERHYSLADQKWRMVRQTTCEADIVVTCRQVHNEAKNIIFENTVCVTASTMVGDCSSRCGKKL